MSSTPKTVVELGRAVIRLNRCLRSAGTQGTLSANKLSALGFLFSRPSCSPGELAIAERLQPQSLTRLLGELEGDGYITRVKSDKDRRQSLLEITPRGKHVLLADMHERDQWLIKATSKLSDVERELLPVVAKVVDHLAQFEGQEDH